MRNRRYQQRRRRRSLSVLVGVVLLAAVAATALLAYQRRDAVETVSAFISALVEGDMEGARTYLSPDALSQDDQLQSLVILARNADAAPRIEADVRFDWPSYLLRREVSIPIVQPEETDWIAVGLRRTSGGWLVSRLPDVLAHPAALLVREEEAGAAAGGRPTLLIRGRELAVSGAGPGPAGHEIGFAVTVGDSLVSFQPAGQPMVLSKLVRYNSTGPVVETETEGIVTTAAGYVQYDLTSQHKPEYLSYLIPGSTGLQAYAWLGQVYAVARVEPFSPERIRVVLNTSGFLGLEHARVAVRSAARLTVHDRLTGRKVNVNAGTTVVLRRSGDGVVAETSGGYQLLTSALRLHIVPAAGERLTVTSLERGTTGAAFSPAYRGYLEVAPGRGSGINLVNDVPLNEYLYSVVPSEMPVSYGLEALKVQAVAARAYAVASMLSGGYVTYGAHAEDSIMSQVYNNLPEVPISNQAVDDTRLELPVYQGNIVDARFYSTSCGFTANAHEVWATGSEFPGEVVPYLRAVPQTSVVETIPNEQAMADFLNRTDLDAPEAGAPFFRWSVTMTRAEMEASIRANLRPRYEADPGFVLSLDQHGRFVSKAVPSGDPIGRLKDIRVINRGEGGNIMVLEVVGTGGTYRIIKEYNVRFTLRPVQYLAGSPPVALRLQNGLIRNNYSILPSAFAVFAMTRDGAGEITEVRVTGGGNGHGAGMSQVGAGALAAQGWTHRDILLHYYRGAEIIDLALGGSMR